MRFTHQGGLRRQRKSAQEAWQQNKLYQQSSKIPLLVASNCDTGGAECVPDGTYVATAAQATAGGDPETAYHIGLTSAREAGSIGVNWLFNPVCDLYMNWRNTIVNTRSYGADPDKVLEMTRAYIRGVRDSGFTIACTAKHFPGDGTEERDQHLVMGCNDMSCEEWYNTFGKVYQGLIDDGIESVMVGHIAQRALSKKLNPALEDKDILPATLSPELLQGVLREELGLTSVKELETVDYHLLAKAYLNLRPAFRQAGKYVGCKPHPNAYYAGDPCAVGFRKETAHIPLMVGSVFSEFFSFSPAPYDKAVLSTAQQEETIRQIVGDEGADTLIPLFKKAYPERDPIDLLRLDFVFRGPEIEYIARRTALNESTFSYLFNLDQPIHGKTSP